MLKKLFQKIKTAKIKKWVNKPKFPIHSLYTGKIVYLNYEQYTGVSDVFRQNFRIVKRFAIFNYNRGFNYSHIKSGQELKEMWCANQKDYCIHKLEEFEENAEMKLFMRKNHLTEDSLLSFAQIVALEEAMNKEKIYTTENDKMFC